MHKPFAIVKRKKTYLQNLVLFIIAVAEINAYPTLTLSSGSVIISNQFYVIFRNTIPQKPVQHMSSRYFAINQDAISVLKPFLLLLSGTVSYQTSDNLHSVPQKLAHNQQRN